MRIKVIIINLITILFVCTTLYITKRQNTMDYLFVKKNQATALIQNTLSIKPSATSTSLVGTSTVVQKKLIKTKLAPVATENATQVITPGPLAIKTLTAIGHADDGNVTVLGVIQRTNFERARNSLPGLTESTELDVSAQIKANDMLQKQYFEHTAPDGKTVSDLVDVAGYEYIRVGENLALGDFSDNVDLLNAWMNSPGHRANILDSRYQNIGVGIAYGMYQGHYSVLAIQHFGRPRSSCPDVEQPLKIKVQDLDTQIAQFSKSLDILKAHIETMRKNGEYVDNTIIDAYNNSVTQYESMVKDSQTFRNTYNAEVRAFNSCLQTM